MRPHETRPQRPLPLRQRKEIQALLPESARVRGIPGRSGVASRAALARGLCDRYAALHHSAYGPPAIHEAWEAFTLGEETEFDPDTPHVQVFMPWFFHRWSPDPEDTSVRDAALHGMAPTEAYLRNKGTRADPLLREYLEACLEAPFSFYEIVRSDPGRGFLLRDIITGEERNVSERSASKEAQHGNVTFAQLAASGGVTLLEACSPYVIKPIFKPQMIAIRGQIAPKGGDLVSGEMLKESQAVLRELYLNVTRQIREQAVPKLQNTDGEPLSLQRLVFDIDSAQAAFDALKHLAFDQSEEELLDASERDAQGGLARVRFDWKKAGNRMHKSWNNTVLGSIEIAGKRLSAEVNSANRADTFKRLVEEALGARARYRATKIQSPEKLLAQARTAERSGETPAEREQQALAELPEVKAKLAEMLEQHYESWISQRLPMLGNKTPLQAVKDPDGREMVEALVLQIERDGSNMTPPLDPAIARRLRERLGLALE